MSANYRVSACHVLVALGAIVTATTWGTGPAIAETEIPVTTAGPAPCTGPDADNDGDIDWADYAMMVACLVGPDGGLGEGCECFDIDGDLDVDLVDAGQVHLRFTLPPGCYIDGVYHRPGEKDAFPNSCRICLPNQSNTDWSIASAGTVCNAGSGDLCDRPEVCDGASEVCPEDIVAPDTTLCSPGSGDACDPPEFCTGIPDMPCPDDSFALATVVCRQGSGDVCDPAERCPGVPDEPCPDNLVAPVGFVCNEGSGDGCDPPERCSGVPREPCPDDVFEPATTMCNRGSGDACDPDEFCPGVPDAPCPDDHVSAAGTVCRTGSGDACDPAERCTGVADEPCPDDVVRTNAFVCNPGSGDGCDPPERCPGVAGEPCPADSFEPATTVCNRGSGDVCDPDEFCPGKPDLPCPDDQVSGEGIICRAGSGDMCDPTERCTGIADEACPEDVVRTNVVICNPGSGDLCDPPERCPGVPGRPCPDDSFEPETTVCNPGSGDGCDPDEYCTGVPDEPCPDDSFKPDTQLCRGLQGPCDVEEYCPGIADGACPDDAKLGTDVVCRDAVGLCDQEEVCDGVHSACPPNALKSAETVCRAAGVTILEDGTYVLDGDGLCDFPEYCTGDRVDCPPDRIRPEGALCRDIAGVCDTAREFCSGTSKHCPYDVSTGGRRCRIAHGACDEPEYCDPADVAYPDCPEDVFTPAGTLCRDLGPSDGFPNYQACDLQEFCDGQSAACPPDEGVPVDTACTRNDGTNGACEDVGQPKLKCVEAGNVADGDLCDADFECASGNCAEHLDRSYRCIASNLVGMGGTCDGRDYWYEGDPDGRQCMRDGGDQLWCCKNGLPAATGQTGTCSECCRNDDTRGGTGKGVVGCEDRSTNIECCNGRCTQYQTDPYNCGECGINCYDEIDICKTAVLGCDGGSGVGQPGTCIYETPCNEAAGEVCYDSCLTCGLTGTCDTCESVPTCSELCCILPGTTLCNTCTSDSDCDPGQTCQSGCGDSEGVAIIFCTSPSYCIEQAGDCVD